MLAKQRFRGRAHAKALLQFFVAAVRDPSDFGREALHVVLFLIQKTFGDKHRHTDVFMPQSLKHFVQLFLNIFPDCVAVGANHHAPFYAGILDKLRLFDDVGIPFCEILLHRGDFRYHFFLLSHFPFLPEESGAQPSVNIGLSVLRYILQCRRRF